MARAFSGAAVRGMLADEEFLVKDNAAGFTGSIPQHYDQGLGPMIFIDYASEMSQRVATLTPGRVLETAAGTGILTRKLRDILPAEVRLTATDLNAPMLEIAADKFRPDEEVDFQPADAMALPFEDSSFDVVVCQFGLMFFPDKDRSFREVRRVLAPGGGYLFSVWDSHRYNPFGRIADEVARRFFPVDPPQFYRVPFSCYQLDPIKEATISAGFTKFNAEVVTIEKQIPDAEAFARGLVYGNPLIDQIQARGGVEPERIVEAVLQQLRSEFGSDPGQMPVQAIMFSVKKPA